MHSLIAGSLKQVVLTDIWKLLSYPDLINLCKSNNTYLQIISNQNTWLYLLNRDHPRWRDPRIKVNNPKEYYELAYWFCVEFHPISIKPSPEYPKHANEFIVHKCQQIISTHPNKPVIALLFLNWNINSFKTVLTGKNIYDLIFQAIKIVSSEYSQSLIELFEEYFEFYDTSFQQICDHIITRWVEPNYEDSLPHIVIVS